MKLRKTLALLLAAVMVLSLLPAGLAMSGYDGTVPGGTEPCTHPNKQLDPGHDPTCVEPGIDYWYCPNCSYGWEVEKPALGHSWTLVAEEPGDCIYPGTAYYSCARCGEQKTEDTALTDHSWTVVSETSATCQTPGMRIVRCTFCRLENRQEIPALGHSMGNWYVVRTPTAQVPGYNQRDCTRQGCGYYETSPTYAGGETLPEETTPSIETEPDDDVTFVQVYTPDESDYKASLSMNLVSIPIAGYFSNDNRIAQLTVVVYNAGDTPLENVSITHPGQGNAATETTYIGTIAPYSSRAVAVSHKVLAEQAAFTHADCEYARATAVFTADGESGSLGPVTIALPVNVTVGELDVALSMPGVPECGFFTAGTEIEVPCTLTSTGCVNGINWWTGTEPYDQMQSGFSLEDDSITRTFQVTITDSDCVNGRHTIDAYAYGYDSEQKWNYDFDVLEIPCGIAGSENNPAEALNLLGSKGSYPENGSFFVPGETVGYTFQVEDVGRDPFGGEFELSVDGVSKGDAWIAGGCHTVTEEDAAAGSWTVSAELVYTTSYLEQGFCSAAVTIPCGEPLRDYTITKEVISTPANDQYYLPGEWVSYRISVENTGNLPGSVSIRDQLLGDVLGFLDLQPGESDYLIGNYQVKEGDAEAGSITNIAQGNMSWDGDDLTKYSNPVTVPTGMGKNNQINLPGQTIGSIDIINSLSVSKSLSSNCVPANGISFREGETLDYDIIITNTGKQTLSNVSVYDSRDLSYFDQLGDLTPGDSFIISYTDTVTAEDCEQGYALNIATAAGLTPDGETIAAHSNTVVVPAGEEKPLLDSDSAASGGETRCRRTFAASCDFAWEYEQEYCSVHARAKKDCAADPANAASIWSNAVRDLYTRWLATLSGRKRDIAQADCDSFFAMINALSPMSNTALTAKLLEDKCTELCYELHSPAGEKNPAGWDNEAKTLNAASGELCAITETGDDKVMKTHTLCAVHAEVMNGTAGDTVPDEQLKWSFFRVSGKVLVKNLCRQSITDEQAGKLAGTAICAYIEQHEKTVSCFRSAADPGYAARTIVSCLTALCSAKK